MLLTIDVGNTNIVVGVFDGTRLTHSWRLLTLRERTADETGFMITGMFQQAQLDVARIDAAVMASVVPPLTPIMREMVARYFRQKPLVVEPTVNAGMPILYERPAEVGADRIANAVAAHELLRKGRPLPIVVADLGTATTFDVVTANGEYLGGVICPGPQIAADALFQRAARLPRVDVRKPATVIGRTTIGAIESGLFYGYLGMVEGLMRRIAAELGGTVIGVATGGLAPLVVPETSVFESIEPDITLQGLRVIWERNAVGATASLRAESSGAKT
jgi:type III pantothenate kinase